MKKVLTIALTLVFLLSVVPLTSVPVFAEAPSATCTVTGTNYNTGASEAYVTADVIFESEVAFAAGMFSVAADNLVFTDCTVAQSVGGEDPEINLELTQNKVMFTGFSLSSDNDIRSYTELTLTLKFVIEGTTLENVESGTSWTVNVTDIDLVNVDEDEYIVDNAVGYINVSGEPPHVHTVGEWFSDEINHWHECPDCSDKFDEAAHTESDWIIDVEAGAEATGQKHKECTVCGKVLAQEEIPAHEHTPGEAVKENEVSPTCTKDGFYESVVYCTVCGIEMSRNQTPVDKLGHDFSDWEVSKASTCTEKGEETRVCSRDNKHIETRDIAVLSHTPAETVIENEIVATYTADGSYEEVVYCSVCKTELSRKTVKVPMKVGTFKITYNLNGGKNNSANPASFKTNAAVTLKNPTRKGYKFVGWYKDSAFKSKITTISKGTAKNVTVYAKWSKVTYKLTYKLNGGKNGKNPSSFTVTSSTITLKNPTRAGYKFGGWYTDAKFKNKITKITKGTAKNITVYAKWTIVTYKLTYKLNGGKNGKNPKSYKVTTKTFTLKAATKKGYTFKGWYSDSKFKKKVAKIAKGSTGNKTLYAKWAKK